VDVLSCEMVTTAHSATQLGTDMMAHGKRIMTQPLERSSFVLFGGQHGGTSGVSALDFFLFCFPTALSQHIYTGHGSLAHGRSFSSNW